MDHKFPCKALKLLGNRRKSSGLGAWWRVLRYDTKAWSKGEEMNKLVFIKLKNFGSKMCLVETMRGHATEWVNHVSNRELLSRLYRELSKLNSKKTIQIESEQGTRKHILPERTANEDLNGYSTSLAIRGMQIMTTRRYHCTPIRLTKI